MVTLESWSDWDGSVVRSNGFDCLQNALKTKQSRDLKGSFEAENEIISFCFQEVTELLRNSKERKKKTSTQCKKSLEDQREEMRGGRSQKIISNKKQAAAATPLALCTASYPPWHQRHPSPRSNSSFPQQYQTPVRHLIRKQGCEDPHQTIKHRAYPQLSRPESTTTQQGCQTPLTCCKLGLHLCRWAQQKFPWMNSASFSL